MQRRTVEKGSNNTENDHRLCQLENWAESEAINLLLRDHEEAIRHWKYQALAKELYRWAGIFNLEFKLQNAHPVVTIDKVRVSTLATYRRGRSGFGTKHTITVNNVHLRDPFHCILRRLLHESIHQWQESHGKPPSKSTYHNKQFTEKALACGLLTNSSGHDLGHTKIFSDLLAKYGVNAPEIEGEPEDIRKPGTSKLKKWTCGCNNVWCAVVEFHAQCLECGNDFV
jgi:hypothetical protein